MSKKITIPKSVGYPYATFDVNGKLYKYNSGAEVDVEDEVAEIVEDIIRNERKGGKIPAGQADYLQNDPMSASYLRNRPFYEDDAGNVHKIDSKFLPDNISEAFEDGGIGWTEEGVISAIEVECNTSEVSGETYAKANDVVSSDFFIYDKDYTIVFNGKEYKCQMYAEWVLGNDCDVVGNASILNPECSDTGEPFVFVYGNLYTASPMSCSISVPEKFTKIHKIYDKYTAPDLRITVGAPPTSALVDFSQLIINGDVYEVFNKLTSTTEPIDVEFIYRFNKEMMRANVVEVSGVGSGVLRLALFVSQNFEPYFIKLAIDFDTKQITDHYAYKISNTPAVID